MSRLGFLGLTVAAWTCLSAPMVQAKTWPGGYANEAGFRPPAHSLSQCCPRPLWWDQVEGPHIETRKDFHDVWLSKDLSDHQKAKAMFRAMFFTRLFDQRTCFVRHLVTKVVDCLIA